MGDKELYLYGIVPIGAVPPLQGCGIKGTDVLGLHCGNVAALVSWMEPELAHLHTDALLEHEKVLTKAMEAGTVIPVAFGHMFDSEADLANALAPAAAELQSTLEHLSGRVEVGLKATWLKAAFLGDIETPDLRRQLAEARKPGAGEPAVMAAGQLVEQLIQSRREQYVAEICHKLADHAVDVQLNEPVTARMVFNAAFLIPRDDQDSFLRLVEKLAAPYADRLEFHFSGPWPPHNFSRVKIGE